MATVTRKSRVNRLPLAELIVPNGEGPHGNGGGSQSELFGRERVETFELDTTSRLISRSVKSQVGGTSRESEMGVLPADVEAQDLGAWADWLYIRRATAPSVYLQERAETVRVVDLFSGCGAMSLGVQEACRALGLRFEVAGAFELNRHALNVYKANFDAGEDLQPVDLTSVLSPEVGVPTTSTEEALASELGQVDLVVAGPPCQGHSDLNNRTRREDPKNRLYYLIARFAEVFQPRWIIIENVVTVLRDRGDVVGRTRDVLRLLGYEVADGIVDAWRVGIPQSRRRHFLVAVLENGPPGKLESVEEMVSRYETPPRPLKWAIGDLRRLRRTREMDRAAKTNAVNKARIDYLFDEGVFDLPDSERPKCHRTKAHRYQAVYGRMDWSKLAPTITTGFVTMGRGRFVHPSQRRTLTPREAARIQAIPDFFDFSSAEKNRTELVEMIGNAVPPKMSYVLALELLR